MQTLEFVINTIISHLILIGPIIIVLYLINLSKQKEQRLLRHISYSFVAILFSILVLLGILIQNYQSILMHYPGFGRTITDIHIFSPHTISKFYLIGPSIWLPSLVALCILMTRFRRYISKVLPITVTSPLHTLILSLSMIIPIIFLTSVIIGIDHLTYNQTEREIITSVWTQNIFLALTGLVGVGWLSRLSFKESLDRLGITKVALRHVLKGVSMGVSFSLVVILLESIAAHYGLVDPRVTKSTDELIGPLFNSLFGILTLGLAAAIGEETIFRGALLPRFGLLYSSLLFTLVHVHYGVSFNLLIVFILGLILGVIRNRYNTTISMVVHATYNITLGAIAYIVTKLMT